MSTRASDSTAVGHGSRETAGAASGSHLAGVSPTFTRVPLGLQVDLAGIVLDRNPERPVEYADGLYRFDRDARARLLSFLSDRRPQILARVRSGARYPTLVPETDPPPMVVTSRNATAYFNLGELVRPFFLRDRPDFPFKEHQRVGVEWLTSQAAGVLADDMGLGKTLQAIAAIEAMQHAGEVRNALVVCPKSLLGVWVAEVRLWAPRLCVVALHSTITKADWRNVADQCHLAVANYEAVRHSAPQSAAFDLVVFDEIHRLKNPNSASYAAAYGLEPKTAWGLTGTPLENRARDLTALLHLLDRKRVAVSDRSLPLPSLRAVAKRYILRRTKESLGRQPTIRERTEIVGLSPEQRKSYEDVIRASDYTTLGGWISTFNRLRDICDIDPATESSTKLDRASVILRSVLDMGEKAVVFSWRLAPLRVLHARLRGEFGPGNVQMITGETSSAKRTAIVDAFQTQERPACLCCSLRATAEGLTLTAANHVLFLNEWWNPAVNTQARDRVNRIGQTKDVFVYWFRTRDTVESRLAQILSEKSDLFHEIINRLNSDGGGEHLPRRLVEVLEAS